MQLKYLPRFKKQYKKLPKQFQEQLEVRLKLFLEDPTDPRLRVHPLNGKYKGYWSLNINGDLRAIYLADGNSIIVFALIGTHSQLYGN
ncbi:MAG: type II toxin-antitoxin system RelE/ParE family toxin [Acidimicrobiales bacterium]|nr:type II toxin-antitoxin system RelE/ParE family toxin [Acidimicrobiales bacterium]